MVLYSDTELEKGAAVYVLQRLGYRRRWRCG